MSEQKEWPPKTVDELLEMGDVYSLKIVAEKKVSHCVAKDKEEVIEIWNADEEFFKRILGEDYKTSSAYPFCMSPRYTEEELKEAVEKAVNKRTWFFIILYPWVILLIEVIMARSGITQYLLDLIETIYK